MVEINDIKVLLIGQDIKLPFNTMFVDNIRELFIKVAGFKPDFIISVGHLPTVLNACEFTLRSKWMHFNEPNINEITNAIRSTYEFNIYHEHRYTSDWPLISVYTATYNSGSYIIDAYNSLREQTWGDWEWVVVDDASTDDTYNRLLELAKADYRVKPYQMPKSGKIGEVKGTAIKLARGKYCVELDHDDMLTDTCLDEVRKGFCKEVDGKLIDDPEVGMVYTDFAEINPDGTQHRYFGPPWEQGYQEVEYRGKKYLQALGPDIYSGFSDFTVDRNAYYLTVGPNHARCYRRETLMKLGGYNPNLPVADDYDVYVRMFLYSKIVRVPKMLYVYRFHDHYNNTTFTRNKSIQDHLQLSRNFHMPAMHENNIARIKRDGFSYFTIIMLSWNTKDLTERAIKSAIESLNGQYSEVLVVDQGSTDGSVEMLREYSNKSLIRLVELETNVGFAAGCNIAEKHVRRPDTLKYMGVPYGHYLVFVNSDCVINKNAVQKAINTIYFGNKVGVAGAWSNNAAFCVCEDSTKAPLPEVDVPVVSGAFFVITKGMFDQAGGFDTRYGNVWEDTDLCAKVRRLGFRTVVAADAWVYHEGHASFNKANISADEVQNNNRPLFDKLNQKIAAVCIAKNEENCIVEWISQWRGAVDEIVVYDTGSTDKTIELAKQHGAKVVQKIYKPEDFSYAEARNNAIDVANSQWIVMTDVDEQMDKITINNLRTIINHGQDIYLLPIHAMYGDGSIKSVIGRPCIFKKNTDIYWTGKVHEKLIGSIKQSWLVNSLIMHKMSYHSAELRAKREQWYNMLQSKEPLYIDKEYRKNIEMKWPLLDWHHPDDQRIGRIFTGELVSIVMPTWKQPKIERAIKSVLSQTYQNWELIVVSDGDDGADNIVKPFLEDKRIRYFRMQKNHGAGGAAPRNFALEYASGDLIAYLDDDNVWTSEHIQSLIKTINETGAKFVFSSFRMDNVDIICKEPKRYRLDTSAVLHRRELIDKHGAWKDRIEAGYAHDAEFFSRWVKAGEKWAATKQITMLYDCSVSGQDPVWTKNVYNDQD